VPAGFNPSENNNTAGKSLEEHFPAGIPGLQIKNDHCKIIQIIVFRLFFGEK
jgi:hypothetical protein